MYPGNETLEQYTRLKTLVSKQEYTLPQIYKFINAFGIRLWYVTKLETKNKAQGISLILEDTKSTTIEYFANYYAEISDASIPRQDFDLFVQGNKIALEKHIKPDGISNLLVPYQDGIYTFLRISLEALEQFNWSLELVIDNIQFDRINNYEQNGFIREEWQLAQTKAERTSLQKDGWQASDLSNDKILFMKNISLRLDDLWLSEGDLDRISATINMPDVYRDLYMSLLKANQDFYTQIIAANNIKRTYGKDTPLVDAKVAKIDKQILESFIRRPENYIDQFPANVINYAQLLSITADAFPEENIRNNILEGKIYAYLVCRDPSKQTPAMGHPSALITEINDETKWMVSTNYGNNSYPKRYKDLERLPSRIVREVFNAKNQVFIVPTQSFPYFGRVSLEVTDFETYIDYAKNLKIEQIAIGDLRFIKHEVEEFLECLKLVTISTAGNVEYNKPAKQESAISYPKPKRTSPRAKLLEIIYSSYDKISAEKKVAADAETVWNYVRVSFPNMITKVSAWYLPTPKIEWQIDGVVQRPMPKKTFKTRLSEHVSRNNCPTGTTGT